MEKVAREIAQQEMQKWLDFKKVSDKKREDYSEQIELLVESIVEGYLSLNEDYTFTQTLKFPENDNMSSLNFKPRLKMSEIHAKLQNAKSGDSDARVCGYIAALTGKNTAIIKALDTEDYNIGQAITIFFL